MAEQVERLVTVWDARFDRLEDKLNKAVRATYGAASKVEKRLDATNDNLRTKLGRGVGETLNNQLAGIAGRAGPAADALGALGTAGLFAGTALGALAIAAGRALEAMAFGDELQASADKLQLSAEALQELQFAAKETDVPLEALDQGLAKLNNSIGLLQRGLAGKKLAAAFAQIGIDREDLAGITNANELLPILADRLGQIEDVTAQIALAKRLGIEDLLPLLRQGSDGLAKMRDRARELGLVVSNETVQALADADRQMELATDQIQANLRVAFSGLAVDIARATGALANFLTGLRQSDSAWAVFGRAASKALREAAIDLIPGGRFARQAGEAARRADRPVPGRRGGSGTVGSQGRPTNPAVAAGFDPIDAASAGGGGKGSKPRDTTAQRTAEVDAELRALQRDLLNAVSAQATGAQARADLQTRLLELDRQAFDAELKRRIDDIKADEGLTEAKKAELIARLETTRGEQDKLEAVRRGRIERERDEQLRREALELTTQGLDAEAEQLLLRQALARSSAEQQAIALRLVELAYQREKAELESLIAAEGVAEADKELARRKLAALEAQQPGRREAATRESSDAAREANGVIREVQDRTNLAAETAAQYAELQRQRDADLISEEVYQQAKAKIAARYSEQRLANERQFFGDLATLTTSSNKTLRGIGKAAAIAQATIDGVLAVQKALAAAPPPFNFILAAAAGAAAAANVGKIAAMADGGRVRGPGGPRDDRVPAMLSAGEFVVNARDARRNLALLQAINAGQVPRFAAGGLVGGARLAAEAPPRRPAPPPSGPHFHLEGAVVTQQLLDQMNAISARQGRRTYEAARRDAVTDAEALRYARELNS